MVPAKGVERWLSQRLSHRLGAAPGAGTASARACGSPRRARWWPPCSGSPTTTRGPPTRWPGRCWRCSTTRSTRPGARPWPGTSVTSTPAPRPSCGRVAATPRRPGLARLFAAYAVQRPTLLADWLDGPGDRRPRRRPRRRPGLAARAVASARRPGRCPAAAPAARGHAGPAARRAGGVRPARPALAVRPHPAAGHRGRAARRAGRAPRRTPLAAAPQRPALGRARRHGRRCGRPRPRTTATSSPATRCSRPSPGTAASCSGRWPRSRPSTSTPRCRTHRTPCSAGCSTTSAATPSRRPAGVLAAGDRSVQVHACHGAARQVDVLREVLLGMLEADPTLEPRDILVMCPDIETYAPLITAGFGLGDLVDGGHPAHRLRVRLADRSLAQTNPLLGRRRAAARHRRQPGHLQPGARPGPGRAGPPPLRLHRRRPRHRHHLGPRVRRPLGLRPRAP